MWSFVGVILPNLPPRSLFKAISSLKGREDGMEKIEEAIDYVNDRLLLDDSCKPGVRSCTFPMSFQ